MSDEETITIRKESLWKYSTFILIAILIVGAFIFFGKSNSILGKSNSNSGGAAGQVIQGPTERTEVSEDDDAVLGNKDAPVTIIEFSDYQCPFCRKFWTETLPELKENYIDTGKVKLVYRDFPIDSLHPSAAPAAIAAECVREKEGDEAYFKYHDKIFEEQNILDSGSKEGPVTKTVTFTNNDLKAWAKEIGYDISSCLDSNKFKNEVQEDFQDGANSGVQGTPGFFINGRLLSGAQPYSVFEQAIEAEL